MSQVGRGVGTVMKHLLIGAVCLGAAACGGNPREKICTKLIELREKAGKKVSDGDRKECQTQMERELKDCKNIDAVATCIQGLTDTKGDDACMAKCFE